MRHIGSASFLALAASGLLTGCPDRSISEVTPQQGRVEYKDIPVTVNRNVDILFVIDDSPSMADKQANLSTNFINFINVLNTIQGGLPDVHIGVVTTDVGTKATQDAMPGPAIGQLSNGGCSGTGDAGNLQTFGQAVTGTYISDIKQPNGTRTKNYTGNLDQVFGAIAKGAGAGGCGFEQPLEAMKRALNNNPQNAGFLRPDAYLAVVFIADEDDCSMSKSAMLGPESAALGPLQSFRCNRFGHICNVGGTSPDQMNQVGTKSQCHPNENSPYLEKVSVYVDFLKGLKPGATEKIIVAGIMGVTEPYQVELRSPPGGGTAQQAVAHSCSYTGMITPANPTGLEVADPPTRLQFFLDQFPNRSTATTICKSDLTDGLVLIGQLLKILIGDPCINGTLSDVDLDTPGPQYDCSVSDVTNVGKPTQAEDVMPACDGTNSIKPCWKIQKDTMNCPAQNPDGTPNAQFVLKVERAETPPPETHVIAYCVTDAV